MTERGRANWAEFRRDYKLVSQPLHVSMRYLVGLVKLAIMTITAYDIDNVTKTILQTELHIRVTFPLYQETSAVIRMNG